MTFRTTIEERVVWILSMDEQNRDTLVNWLRITLANCEGEVCGEEMEDIGELIEELGVPL